MPLARRSWSSIVSPPVIPGWCASTRAGTALIRQVIGGKTFCYPWSTRTPAHNGQDASPRREMELIDPAQPAANSKGGLVAFDGFEGDGSAELSDAHNSGR